MADKSTQFNSNLARVLKTAEECLAKAGEQIGMAAESHAKLHITEGVYKTPETWYTRTGNLRNSITHTTVKEAGSVTVVIGTAVKYAP